MKNIKYFKLFILLVSIFLGNGIFSQKIAKLKIRKSIEKVQYYALPEVLSPIKHHNYFIDFTDVNSKKYSFGIGKFEISGTGYLQGLVIKTDSSDYSVYVTQVSHKKSPKSKEIVPAKYKVKNESGMYTTMEGVGYKFFYDQKFNIRILDNLDNKKEVFNKDFDFESFSLFPGDFGKVKGYANSKILSSKLSSFIKSKKEQNKENDFEDVALKSSTKRTMNKQVKDEINKAIGTKRYPIIVSFTKFKTKDSRLSFLDSLNYYSEESMALFNSQKKTKIYKNAHSEEVFKIFDKYYHALKTINLSEVSPILGDDVQISAFKYGIKSDLFIASLFTSRYDEAIKIYKEVKNEYDKEVAANKSSTFGTKVEICFINIDKLYEILLREQRLYNEHKEFYNFYK